MEAIERYTGIFAGDEIRATRRFTDFAAGEALQPNDDAVVQRRAIPPASVADADQDDMQTPFPFDPSAEIEWSPVGRCATSVSDIFRPP